jgi:hypothetical protein
MRGRLSSIAQILESDTDKVGHELQRKIAQRVLHYHQIKTWRGDRLARGYCHPMVLNLRILSNFSDGLATN